MVFALHIHTSLKNHHFRFFPCDGGKLSIKTTVEKTITSHFSATLTYIKPSLMVFFDVFAPFRKEVKHCLNKQKTDKLPLCP